MEQQTKRVDTGNSIVKQGSILVMSSIIVRLIGFFYRVPLYNMLGDEGVALYSNAYDVYSLLLIISSYGIPIAVSKLVASKLSNKEYNNAHRVFKLSLLFAFISGSIASLIVWFGAEFITREIVNIPLAAIPLKALSPTILIVSILGVFRGYFQGMNTMVPTALSQIIEQILNAIVSVVAAASLLSMGIEFGSAGGTIGTGVGALTGLIFMISIYLLIRPKINRRLARDTKTIEISTINLSKMIALTIVPIVIGTTVINLTNFLDNVMFNQSLGFRGYTDSDIRLLSGILNGKYKLIITFPISIGSALAAATVPSIASSLNNSFKDINRKIDVAIRFLMLIAIPSAFGILTLAGPILNLVFRDESTIEVVRLLQLGSVSIIFFCLSTIAIGILQGLDRIKLPIKHSVISMTIKMIINFIFFFVLRLSLFAMIVSNIIFSIISAYLNLKAVKKITKLNINIKKAFILPSVSATIMGVIVFLVYNITHYIVKSNAISTLVAIAFGIATYGILIIKTKAINENELLGLPQGGKLVKLCYKFRLL
ncbi:stage V sporulation protein B [Natranaerovirga pectinivora]|uniref:Stage V sporulation protein B n=1 Tax=Natranaerovirga pectinivora TaxID=682400 RepID=A0A4R3MQA9_9FIRM|nr:polysaccharide biosynthesis protein [Natranaerovirga pectinivora]TCT17062.1 stage V sporulation protein B [Natranaerovirga pectinivora]